MQTLTLLLELALIVALGAVWWLARRDLLMLVTRQQTPTLREMESVQASIEKLLERLEAQTDAVESRISPQVPNALQHDGAVPSPNALHTRQQSPNQVPEITGPGESAAKTRYSEVYRLAGAGLDADEIAQRTGLGSGEVRLVISLRPASSDTGT